MTEPLASPTPPRTRARLHRSRDDRVIAGVCGGMARRLEIDPLVLRVVAVVLVFYGGVGLLLYALAWLLLPEDQDADNLLEQAFTGERRSSNNATSTVLLAVALIIFVVITGIGVLNSSWVAGTLLALTAIGLLLLLQRDRDSAAPSQQSPPSPPSSPDEAGPPAPTTSTPAARPQAAASPATADEVTWDPEDPWGVQPGSGSWSPPPPAASWDAYQEPPPEPVKRPRSALPMLTLSVLLLTLGGLWAIDVAGADVAASGYLATALTVVGLGLLVGAWFGRARGLIVLGIGLSILLLLSTLVGRAWAFQGEDVLVKPTSVDQVSGEHSYSVGEVRYDLSDVDFGEDSAGLTIHSGIGRVVVVLPTTVDVSANASVGIGSLTTLSSQAGGLGVSRHVRDNGADGRGGGSLQLDVDLGIGEVVVIREAT